MDNADYSSTNWTNIDPAATFVEDETACQVLSSGDHAFELGLSVYPNPTSDTWIISAQNNIITSVEVFNLLGKRVVLQTNNSTNIAISTQGLTSGIYIARITSEQGTKSVKLIKE